MQAKLPGSWQEHDGHYPLSAPRGMQRWQRIEAAVGFGGSKGAAAPLGGEREGRRPLARPPTAQVVLVKGQRLAGTLSQTSSWGSGAGAPLTSHRR